MSFGLVKRKAKKKIKIEKKREKNIHFQWTNARWIITTMAEENEKKK